MKKLNKQFTYINNTGKELKIDKENFDCIYTENTIKKIVHKNMKED